MSSNLTKEIIERIFKITDNNNFEELTFEVLKFQYKNNIVYKNFVDFLGININNINKIENIPFLPIEFFKTHNVVCNNKVEITFYSSGTTDIIKSKHHITDLKIYEKSFIKGFESFYGKIKDYVFLMLLPSYFEQKSSSLLYMCNYLIENSSKDSGYYLNNFAELFNKLLDLKKRNKKVILLGVSYALIDFSENYKLDFPELIVMETGGMKGRRKEIIKEEFYNALKKCFGVTNIHSEYGMTELLSQAYSTNNGEYRTPPWMNVLIRDINDPLNIINNSGGINVIDLANINSCSFIATKDLGKINSNNSFSVLGRFDNSDIRGCNLLIS